MQEILIENDGQKTPKNIQQYLSNPKNKMNLINYTFERCIDLLPSELKKDQIIYLANTDGSMVQVIKGSSTNLAFVSDHKEADSKMIAFCKFLLSQSLERMIISSPDTDVLVICCYHKLCCLDIPEVWFKTGVSTRRRFIPVHDINTQLGSLLTNLLPVFHAITGCDSVSSFNGIGKKTAFKLLRESKEKFREMIYFGDTPCLDTDSSYIEVCISFICLLYDSCESYDINSLRYKLFTRKNKSAENLPPTLDALIFHLRRACYQAFIWKSSCKPMLHLPTPIGNGWHLNESILLPEFMIKAPIPESTIELICCKCKKGCRTNACSCRKSSIICTDACACDDFEECENTEMYDHENDDDDDSD